VQYRSVSTEAALDDRKCSTELRQSGLPTPTAMPMRITAAELRALMDDPALDAGKDYLVVGVRRTDMDVCRLFIDRSIIGLQLILNSH
jgi:hypothetical protein